MKCDRVQQWLAVTRDEWPVDVQAELSAHLEACEACAAIARAYEADARRIAALPRRGMSLEGQQVMRTRIAREAGRVRRRLWLSNAFGGASVLLFVIFFAGVMAGLLSRPPVSAPEPPIATATSHAPPTSVMPTPTSKAFVPTATPPAAGTRPVILVDNSPRAGLGPDGGDFYALLDESRYEVRTRFALDRFYPAPGENLIPPPYTGAELVGVDLVVVPWGNCYAASAVAGQESVTYDFNLTLADARTLREFVRGGGAVLFVLDPTYQCDFSALEVLGIQADETQARIWEDDDAHLAFGSAGGSTYGLAAHYRFQPVRASSGRAWARVPDVGDALAVESYGVGRVAALGLPSLVDGIRTVSPEDDAGQPAPLYTADNLSFLVAVVEELAGVPSGLDTQRIAWEATLDALREGLAQQEERHRFWTPKARERAAAGAGEGTAFLDERVAAVEAVLDDAGRMVDALGPVPDPAAAEAARERLGQARDELNALDGEYGALAREPREARQARQLRPLLYGVLAGALVAAGVSWRIRRPLSAPVLDATSTVLPAGAGVWLATATAGLLLFAHLLVAWALVEFGQRAGGYPVHAWGVWPYLCAAVVAILLYAWRRVDHVARLALPLLVTVVLLQVHTLTELAGATYSTYRDYEQGMTLVLNLGIALAFVVAGAAYRRPRQLAAAGGTHLALSLGTMVASSAWFAVRDGAVESWQITRVVFPPSPLPYLVIVYILGLLAARSVRPRVFWSALAGLLVVFVAGGTGLYLTGDTWTWSSVPPLLNWLYNLLLLALLPTISVVASVYVWDVRRRRAGRRPLHSPLAATLLLLGVSALLMPLFFGDAYLPYSGAGMPWRGDFQVPESAWTLGLPVARLLAGAAPWLVLLAATLQVWGLVGSGQAEQAPLLALRTARRIWAFAGTYAVLIATAVILDVATFWLRVRAPDLSAVWAVHRATGVWSLASSVAVLALAAWLTSRGRGVRRDQSALFFAAAVAIQFPAWILGLSRLRPLWGLFDVVQSMTEHPGSQQWGDAVPWLATAALVLLIVFFGNAWGVLRGKEG